MPVLGRLSMAALAALSVALVSGCMDQYQYEYPDTIYRPTMVGVIENNVCTEKRWSSWGGSCL